MGTLARSVKHKLGIQSQCATEVHRSATDVKVNALVAAQPRAQERGGGGGGEREGARDREIERQREREGASLPLSLPL